MKCVARGCEEQLAPFDPQDQWVRCNNHRTKWDRLQIELPLAIQELHALALLYHDTHSRSNPGDPIRQSIIVAQERVDHLRHVELALGGSPL
jgi:hypothetical protein